MKDLLEDFLWCWTFCPSMLIIEVFNKNLDIISWSTLNYRVCVDKRIDNVDFHYRNISFWHQMSWWITTFTYIDHNLVDIVLCKASWQLIHGKECALLNCFLIVLTFCRTGTHLYLEISTIWSKNLIKCAWNKVVTTIAQSLN